MINFTRSFILLLTLILTWNQLYSKSVEIFQKQTPVLTLKESNQVMLFKLNTGKPNSIIRKITIDLTGTTDLNDLEQVIIIYRGEDQKDSILFGHAIAPYLKLNFTWEQALDSGTGYFGDLVKLRNSAEILHNMEARLVSITSGNEIILPEKSYKPLTLRFGIALCRHGEDNVHTYRIPGLAKTNEGTLLAVFDRRLEAHRDPQGAINIGLKRSIDGGRTWPEKNWILLYEERSAYSSITSVDEQTIGILYEGSQAHFTFQKISLSELLK